MTASFEAVVRALEIAVFRPLGPEDDSMAFELLGHLPPWGNSIFAPNSELAVVLGECLPYIGAFIPDALQLWASGTNGKISSGVWTELDGEGREHQLEAVALLEGDLRLMIIISHNTIFGELHQVYQRARETALESERRIRELNQEQRRLEVSLQRRLARREEFDQISETLQENGSAVLICKLDGGVEVMNAALVDIYKIADGDLRRESMLDKWIREAEAAYPEMQRVVQSGSYWEGEFESDSEPEGKKWIRLTIGPVFDEKGALAHYVCIANDISAFRKSEGEIERLAEIDLTTHLPNRRHFWSRLARLIEECGETGRLALIYMDLDNFKRINETYGHQTGDFVLSTVAARIYRAVKKGEFVAHLGGDEFAVIVRFEGQTAEIVEVARDILDVVRRSILSEHAALTVTASIGIGLYPRDGADATTLMKNADIAMFHAKKTGRGRYVIFSSGLSYDFSRRIELESYLREAVEQKAFTLAYQPQVCASPDEELRLEALIRWSHPACGNVSPAEFIPLAEETGMISDIGAWVLETACRQAKELLDEGLEVTMAVNVSAHELKEEDFADRVKAILASTGLPPRHLELEITETALIEEMDRVIGPLTALRGLGVSVSLDDFGSGFCSLNYLKNLPVDNLKIDRSFVKDLPWDEEGNAITTSVINLAHQLKMKVIAEGVETEDQVRFLAERGCDYMQGFLFHYPMEAGKIRAAVSVPARAS